MPANQPQHPRESHSATAVAGRPEASSQRRRFTWLLAAFAATYLASTYLIVNDIAAHVTLRWALALLPSALAAVAVIAYWRYLRVADELSRLIELHGLAYSVSAGFIAWPAFELLDRAGLATGTELNLPVLVMVAFYTIGVVLTRRRYW